MGISIEQLTPDLRKKYHWDAVGLLTIEASLFRASLGSIKQHGGLRNIPELSDFSKAFLDPNSLDGCLALDDAERLVGFMLWADDEQKYPQTPSYDHKIKFIKTYSEHYKAILFIDLVLVRREKPSSSANNRSPSYKAFKGMLAKAQQVAQEKNGGTVCVGLISPFNAYMLHVIQKAGFKCLLNKGDGNLYRFAFSNHWIFGNRETYWVPVVFERGGVIQSKNSGGNCLNQPEMKLEILESSPPSSLTDHIYASIKFPLCPELSLLTDRICAYLLFTTNFKKHPQKYRKVPITQFNDMRQETLLEEYYLYSQQVQSVSYRDSKNFIKGVLSKLKEQFPAKPIRIIDIGSGHHSWHDDLGKSHADLNIDTYDVNEKINGLPSKGPIDVFNFPPSSFYDDLEKEKKLLVMVNLLARLYDYNVEGRDMTTNEKLSFISAVTRYASDTESCVVIQESTLAKHADIDLEGVEVKEVMRSRCQDIPDEKLKYWSYYWWYALAEKRVQPFDIRNSLGSEPFMSVNSKAVNDLSEIRTSHIYQIESELQRVYDVLFFELKYDIYVHEFTPGLLSADQFEVLLSNSKEKFGHQRLVGILREYQSSCLMARISIRFVFVSYNKQIVTNPSVNEKIAETISPGFDIAFVSSYDNDNQRTTSIYIQNGQIEDGGVLTGACSFFLAAYDFLTEFLAENINSDSRNLLSVTVGRYVTAFEGFVSCSANRFVAKDTIRTNELARFVQKLDRELTDKVEIKLRDNLAESIRESARAAIMSRNMSHNLGSHALANSKFMESVGLLHEGDSMSEGAIKEVKKIELQNARHRLQSFNQYCQGRLDFIARKLSDETDKPEPLFFVTDVLKGFMNQKVLLDTLLQDNGFTTNNIAFHIDCNGEKRIWLYDEANTSSDEELVIKDTNGKKCDTGEDTLVGIAGGITGCHALYALIENLLRNAAKYNSRKIEEDFRLELHIELKDPKNANKNDCYLLRLRENLTNDKRTDKETNEEKTGQITRKIRKGLSADIIDSQGKRTTEGHGVQEMKLCAEYLACDLVFQHDSVLFAEPNENEDKRYSKFLKEEGLPPAPEKETESSPVHLSEPRLRAFSSEDKDFACGREDNSRALVYEMLLPKPVLVGITCMENGLPKTCDETCKSKHPNVKCYTKLEKMAEGNAYFGLILARDAKENTIDHTFGQIAEYHNFLPYRLMVVSRNDQDREAWERVINEKQASPDKPFAKGMIPYRRVHTINYSSLFEGISSISQSDWEEIHIPAIYECWLRAWKKKENPSGDGERWKLCIGFQRPAEKIKPQWEQSLKDCTAGDNLFDVVVLAGTKETAGDLDLNTLWVGARESSGFKYFSNEENNQACSKKEKIKEDMKKNKDSFLVFDNHGFFFDGAEDFELRFYHEFGMNQLSLFQSLETPPATKFGFAFFLLSVFESCLTNIVVFDERVADSTISKNNRLIEKKLKIMQDAGIFPLFSFQKKDGESATCPKKNEDIFISQNISAWIDHESKEGSDCLEKAKKIIAEEGIRCSDNQTTIRIVNPSLDLNDLNEMQRYPDVLIMHEGIIDTLAEKKCWKKPDHQKLYSLLPSVIRTSGRGQASRELGNELPFLELNVLSDSCYGSMNKKKLAYASLGVSGNPVKEKKNVL